MSYNLTNWDSLWQDRYHFLEGVPTRSAGRTAPEPGLDRRLVGGSVVGTPTAGPLGLGIALPLLRRDIADLPGGEVHCNTIELAI